MSHCPCSPFSRFNRILRGIPQYICTGCTSIGAVSTPVLVLPSQGNLSESVFLLLLPQILKKSSFTKVFSHIECQREECRSSPSTKVVSGPPPRNDVRYPLPPSGAFVCIVKRAVAQQVGHMQATVLRLTK